MIINGNNIEELKKFDDNYFDSIVTDPPYEIGFMGKSWDASGIANNSEMWSECLRVLKPGGYLLSFSATRTYHRMAVAIEDSGFEIRDMIEWVYGSGFPKSLNIGKAVDKMNGREWGDRLPLNKYIRECREKTGKSRKEVDAYFGYVKAVSHWESVSKWDSSIIRLYDYKKLKPLIMMDDRFDELVERIEREREVVGTAFVNGEEGTAGGYQNGIASLRGLDVSIQREINITKGTSEFEGKGTALKPAHEPICMARKPLAEKTVAENVLKYGTGGINIDESRVEANYSDSERRTSNTGGGAGDSGVSFGTTKNRPPKFDGQRHNPEGRFPANLIHDNSEEVRECFPETVSKWGKVTKGKQAGGFLNGSENNPNGERFIGDSGNASRFFKSIPQGRFPANLIHDNSEEVRECFPETHSRGNYKVKQQWKSSEKGWQGPPLATNSEEGAEQLEYDNGGNASRFFKSIIYTAKASKSERNKGCEGLEAKKSELNSGGIGRECSVEKRLGDDGINAPTMKNSHPTVKPIALMEYLIKMVTPTNGIVLDPFMGSGSTGVACVLNDFEFVGIDLDKDYCEIARARIEGVKETQTKMF